MWQKEENPVPHSLLCMTWVFVQQIRNANVVAWLCITTTSALGQSVLVWTGQPRDLDASFSSLKTLQVASFALSRNWSWNKYISCILSAGMWHFLTFSLSICSSKNSAIFRAVRASLLPPPQPNLCLIHIARNMSLTFDSDSFPSPLLHSFFFSFVEALPPYFTGYTVWKLAENQVQIEFRTDSHRNLRDASIGIAYDAPKQPDTNRVSTNGSGGLT